MPLNSKYICYLSPLAEALFLAYLDHGLDPDLAFELTIMELGEEAAIELEEAQ